MGGKAFETGDFTNLNPSYSNLNVHESLRNALLT